VEQIGIEFVFQLGSAVGCTQKGRPAANAFIKALQGLVGIVVLSRELAQRHRIGQAWVEFFLVKIQADSYDAASHFSFFKYVLYQHPAYLPVPDPDIVGPLYPGSYSLGGEEVVNGKSGHLDNPHSIICIERKLGGFLHPQEESEGKIEILLGKPGMGALTSPCGLETGRYH